VRQKLAEMDHMVLENKASGVNLDGFLLGKTSEYGLDLN